MRNILKTSKVGLVFRGCGLYSAHQAGFASALGEIVGFREPHVIVAVSGGVAVSIFYLAERFKEMFDWPRLFADKRFISRRRLIGLQGQAPAMDVNFLVDSIFIRQVPNLFDEAAQKSTKIFVATTRFPEGSPHWSSGYSDLGKYFRATMTVPGIAGDGVMVGEELHLDGCLSVTTEMCVKKALQEGAEIVIVIDNEMTDPASFLGRLAIRIACRRLKKDVREALMQFAALQVKPFSAEPPVFACRARRFFASNPFDPDPDANYRAIQEGYEDGIRMFA